MGIAHSLAARVMAPIVIDKINLLAIDACFWPFSRMNFP
jgi:hypothetical protein